MFPPTHAANLIFNKDSAKILQIDFGKQTLVIFRTKYFVIASDAWQSPGREPYKINAVFRQKGKVKERRRRHADKEVAPPRGKIHGRDLLSDV